jgi:tetratricopeptide (TPR) repeat protein
MMAEDFGEAIRTGEEALAICDELSLDAIQAAVLVSMGPAHAGAGDPENAIADLERGTALAEAINSYDVARGYGNLGEVLIALGDLAGGLQARRSGLEIAERLGLRWYARWLQFEELEELFYVRGEWDELLRRAEGFVRERTVMAVTAFELAIRVRLAQGDLPAALATVTQMIEAMKDSPEPQIVGTTLQVAAFAQLAAGEREACEDFVDRIIEFFNWDSLWTYVHTPLLGIVLHALGRGEELAELAAGARIRTPWLEASLASAAGNFGRAAEIYEQMGDRPDEAYARLKAGEQLVTEDRRAEAVDQLERALSFFRSVGATAYISEAEALLSGLP